MGLFRVIAYFRKRWHRYVGAGAMWLPLVKLFPYIWRYRRTYLGLTTLATTNILFALFVAWFLQKLAQLAIGKHATTILWMVPLAIGIMLLYSTFGFLENYLQDVVVNRVERDVQNDLYRHTLQMQAERFNAHHSGDMISRLTYDVYRVGAAVGVHILNIIRLVLSAVGALCYLAVINWKLTLIVVCCVPPIMLIMMLFSVFVRANSKRISEAVGRLQVFLNESLGGLTVIRTFTLEDRFASRFQQETAELLRIQLQNAKLRSGAGAVGTMAHFLAYLLSFSLGAYYVAQGTMNIGALFAFMALVQHLVGPMMAVPGELGGYQAALAAVERIWEMMREAKEVDAPVAVGQASPTAMGITCHKVRFDYAPNTTPALNSIDIVVPPGKIVALVGPSGAGKSTLFQLLLGLYPATSGRIAIGGQWLDELPRHVLRKMIAYVPQDTFLFSGTIFENIRYGAPAASEQAVIQAAKDANAHEFIMKLPAGYQTEVGERAVRLSGGQRQRIAIARAFLKNSPILLLDEVTSALDAESEQLVQQAFQRLFQDRTVLIIAHRLSTIQIADLVYVLDKGNVVEQGTHAELMRNNALYARLRRLQLDGDTQLLSLLNA